MAADSNSLVSAALWIEELLTGQLATTIAILGIAVVGLLMMQGRLDWRRALSVSAGCFLLFGARPIATGFLGKSYSEVTIVAAAPISSKTESPVPILENEEDPYSGAAFYGAN